MSEEIRCVVPILLLILSNNHSFQEIGRPQNNKRPRLESPTKVTTLGPQRLSSPPLYYYQPPPNSFNDWNTTALEATTQIASNSHQSAIPHASSHLALPTYPGKSVSPAHLADRLEESAERREMHRALVELQRRLHSSAYEVTLVEHDVVPLNMFDPRHPEYAKFLVVATQAVREFIEESRVGVDKSVDVRFLLR